MFYKNNKIFRFINKYKGIIVTVVTAIIFFLLLIKTLSHFAITNQKVSYGNNTINEIETKIEQSRDTITSDETVNEETAKNNYELINKFVEYCNKGDVQNAYNLLTEECKQNVYSTIDIFNENYVQVVFKNSKQIEVQSWADDGDKYTYLVTYTGDILSTGNYSESSEFQDYITVDTEKEGLNINRYIGRKEINKVEEVENIKFQINSIDIFKDYEIYNINISNLRSEQIILDNLTSTSSTYIETNKETKINCSNYEAGINSFKFNSGVSKNIKLKFIKQYNLNIVDEKIVFSSAILDIQNIEDTQSIRIEL